MALVAAILFGISTPLIQKTSLDIGPLTTAFLLYIGATIIGLVSRQTVEREAKLRRPDLPRLLLMGILGAAIAPVALAWGLQHASSTSASLMLTLEALFTALFAWTLYRETMDNRVITAMSLITIGGLLLIIEQGHLGKSQGWGLLAVLFATVAWGADNALSKPLAERDPAQVVLGKALLGCGLTGCLAWIIREPFPPLTTIVTMILIGASGYGLSLKLYLLAQREFGASRTGSVFAFAPFIGAAFAFVLGEKHASWLLASGAGLMMLGVILHLMERHDHEHTHEEMDHEHAHRHDDGHHDHTHADMPLGIHSHPHRHTTLTHSHPHVPDAHHQHIH